MPDFSELCPLFETGVYKEICFPAIDLITGTSSTTNLFAGTMTMGVGMSGPNFGRTVVVTGAFVQRYSSNHTAENLYLGHRTSGAAAATAFGTATITTTFEVYNEKTWQAMTVASKTFTSSEVLNLCVGTTTATHNGFYSLIIRYREA